MTGEVIHLELCLSSDISRYSSQLLNLSSIMAPDLNAVTAGEKFDYSTPGSSGYNIRQDLTWLDPSNRKLRVLTIGGGVSGILMAYQIQKQCSNIEHVIYEKNADMGGTWLENR